jgi:hypothetical protein
MIGVFSFASGRFCLITTAPAGAPLQADQPRVWPLRSAARGGGGRAGKRRKTQCGGKPWPNSGKRQTGHRNATRRPALKWLLHRTQQLRIDPGQPCQGTRVQPIVFASALPNKAHIAHACATINSCPSSPKKPAHAQRMHPVSRAIGCAACLGIIQHFLVGGTAWA